MRLVLVSPFRPCGFILSHTARFDVKPGLPASFLALWKDADPDLPSSRKPRRSTPGLQSATDADQVLYSAA